MPVNFRGDDAIIDSLTGGTHQWTIGTGSIGIFTQNGDTAENSRVYDTDPFGNTSIVWETTPDLDDDNDGGWDTSYMSLDNTQLYRFSVWVQRITADNADPGTFYYGLTGSPTHIIQASDGTTDSNPYWFYQDIGALTQDTWYLFIGHVFPKDYPHTYGNVRHPNTGYYTRASGKISSTLGGNMSGDAQFAQTTTSIRQRVYHFYCTVLPSSLQFFDPRIELCDGSEPTIENLLNGESYEQPTFLSSESILTTGSANKVQGVTATGGDDIKELGEWRSHIFTGSGTFDLISYKGASVYTEYLIVGGGGGAGSAMGGGGGGGGVITGFTYLTGNTYSITVGAGGAGAPAGTAVYGANGGDSTFNGLTADGGGRGGLYTNTGGRSAGTAGGSGGGASGYNNNATPASGGAGTVNQGYAGGNQGSAYYSGGGGGAGASGVSGNSEADGGSGKYSNIMGRPYYWGGGGGGAGYSIAGGDGGRGGGGGGAVGFGAGEGGKESIAWGVVGTQGATSSQANVPGGNGGISSGGGGGGGSHYNLTNAGGNGGSGIVILRYKYR